MSGGSGGQLAARPSRNPETKRLRAMGMLEMRLRNHTLREIADEYRCSTDTVDRHLMWAAREGNILKHEEDILSRLVPKAIATYEKALDTNDVFVAKDILGMLAKLSERVDKRTEHVEELSLNAWLKTRQRTDAGAIPGSEDPAGRSREDALSSDSRDVGALPGHVPEGPAPVGAVHDAVLVPDGEPPAGRAAGKLRDIIDAEVVGTEDGAEEWAG